MSNTLPNRPEFVYPDATLEAQREIRVLEVRNGNWDDEICCHLSVQPLNSHSENESSLPYTDLSYTWGTWNDRKTISLNGQSGFSGYSQSLERAEQVQRGPVAADAGIVDWSNLYRSAGGLRG